MEILAIAKKGLTARARLNASGDNETGFLEPLFETAESGRTPAERLLDLYHGKWDEDVCAIYRATTY